MYQLHDCELGQGSQHRQWSPAKGNSSFELQRNPQQEKHSHWGEQNILYCSFEMVPAQFPQSHASNSFSILTFPHYCVSREKTPTFQHPGISFPEIPKIQLGSPLKQFSKNKSSFFKKASLCSDKFHNYPSLHMSLLRSPPSSFFSSAYG